MMAQFFFGLLAGVIVGLVMEWVIDWGGLFPKRTANKRATKNAVNGKSASNEGRIEAVATPVNTSSNSDAEPIEE